jgi:hypothetical protein
MCRLCLLMRCRLLSISPPHCHLFAGWLSCCNMMHCLHLASPFAVPLPHVSILYLPPSFAPADCGCCVASRHAASTYCPLINTTVSQGATTLRCADNSTSRSPLVLPDWLPRYLLWHLRLTSASLPSTLCLHLLSRLVLVCPGLLSCCLLSTCNSAITTHHCLSRPWLVVVSST